MAASATALIQYVGKQQPRGDDVLRTTRSWPNPGAVVEIPRGEAAHYLAHPGEWREITAKEMAELEKAKEIVTIKLDEIIAQSENMPAGELKALIDQLIEVCDRREADERSKARTLVESTAKSSAQAAETAEILARPNGLSTANVKEATAPVSKVDARTREAMKQAVVAADDEPLDGLQAMVEHFKLSVDTATDDLDATRKAVISALTAAINA